MRQTITLSALAVRRTITPIFPSTICQPLHRCCRPFLLRDTCLQSPPRVTRSTIFVGHQP